MKPFLEGNEGYWHAGNEQSAINGHDPAEREFFITYFEFSLLWAAEKMGAKRANEIESIFRAIDQELATAVQDKRIVAGTPGPALLAAPIAGDWRRFLSAQWASITSLLSVEGGGYVQPGERQDSPAMIERASRLTNSWAGRLSKPNIEYSMRGPILRAAAFLQRCLYPLLLLSMPVLLVWRRREAITQSIEQRTVFLWSFTVPLAALLAFCSAMAMVEVLGFRLIGGMSYNALGYSPLTVLCAFAFTGIVVLLSHGKRAPHRPQATTSSTGSA